jgi:hypothetical protein
VTVYDSWRVPFTTLARENGFTPENIDEAAAALTALIAATEASVSDARRGSDKIPRHGSRDRPLLP